MSKVYSFRLDENNPREAQAREVIDAWVSKGYSLRQVVVNTMLNVSKEDDPSKDLEKLVEKLGILLKKVDQSHISFGTLERTNSPLPSAFLESVSKTIKPGENIKTF